MSTQGTEDAIVFMAKVAAASAADLAWTNNAIREHDERVQRRLAETIIRLAEGIEEIPPMVRSVHLEALLFRCQVGIAEAHRIVDKEDR